MTAREAAARYTATSGRPISPRRIQQLAAAGRIPSQRHGRALLFTAADIDMFAALDRPGRPEKQGATE